MDEAVGRLEAALLVVGGATWTGAVPWLVAFLDRGQFSTVPYVCVVAAVLAVTPGLRGLWVAAGRITDHGSRRAIATTGASVVVLLTPGGLALGAFVFAAMALGLTALGVHTWRNRLLPPWAAAPWAAVVPVTVLTGLVARSVIVTTAGFSVASGLGASLAGLAALRRGRSSREE